MLEFKNYWVKGEDEIYKIYLTQRDLSYGADGILKEYYEAETVRPYIYETIIFDSTMIRENKIELFESEEEGLRKYPELSI